MSSNAVANDPILCSCVICQSPKVRRERDEAREKLAKANAIILEQGSIADRAMAATSGEVDDFALSFPIVRAVSDLRLRAETAEAQIARLREALRTISDYASWQTDDDADPEDRSPEDMVAHINGLIRRACREALK